MTYEHISYEVDDNIATITLNRPDKLNAFTRIMLGELLDVFDRIDADDDVRAVIVTGAGRAFCAGADLAQGGDTFNYEKRDNAQAVEGHRDGGGKVTLRIFNCRKPVIGAINGPAVGVGVTMQLPFDIRIASEKARFGFVFARRGVVPEACSSWFLPRLVGISQALDWTMSGRVFEADEALAGGLVKEVVPSDQLMDRAREFAASYKSETSAVSVALARQMMWRMLGASHPYEAHQVDSAMMYEMGQSADVREGVSSFLEKRPAEFPMRVSADMPKGFPWWTGEN